MIDLKPTTINELEEFTKSFENSQLGKNYFSSIKLIQETFFEFFECRTLLTARSEENIVGFICYIPNGAFHSFPYIHLLTIIPKFRGQRFGKQILNKFENQYINKSTKIFLVVADFNPKAKSFYEKNGYTQVGIIPSLYRPDIDEFLMMKEIE